jgi:hypothetical protein
MAAQQGSGHGQRTCSDNFWSRHLGCLLSMRWNVNWSDSSDVVMQAVEVVSCRWPSVLLMTWDVSNQTARAMERRTGERGDAPGTGPLRELQVGDNVVTTSRAKLVRMRGELAQRPEQGGVV